MKFLLDRDSLQSGHLLYNVLPLTFDASLVIGDAFNIYKGAMIFTLFIVPLGGF